MLNKRNKRLIFQSIAKLFTILKKRVGIKIAALFFKETDKLIVKLISKYNRSRMAKSNLTKKNEIGALIQPNFKTY